jgi:hypothetical protein
MGKSAQEAVIYARVLSFPCSMVGRKHAEKTTGKACHPFHFERCTIAGPFRRVHDRHMTAARTRPTTPDLFAPASTGDHPATSANPPRSSPGATHVRTTSSESRHVLPADLSNAIKHLDDQQFNRLVSAVVAEQKRRGRKLPVSDEGSRKRRVQAVAAPLTQGKLNAVRAAFKAGVTPSRIARQFGISQSDVRKALAGNLSK